MSRNDHFLLAGFCVILFGICLVSERPLSIHEAVLPVTSRLMLADGDLVVPKTGEAPWLESPPLPQWISVALALPFGEVTSHFVARLGNVIVAICIVLMTAWVAGRLLGQRFGMLTGLILATMCEFTKYAWLAEDEIYLCAVITAVVAWFVKMEFPAGGERELAGKAGNGSSWLVSPWNERTTAMVVFFVLLGMTNLCKGLIFGMVLALIPCVSFIVLQFRGSKLQPYLWVWGVLLSLGIALAWPVACYVRYPDVVDVWKFDLGGRVDGAYAAINQPAWYYPVNMLWMFAPWTLVIPVGLWMMRGKAWAQRSSAERFVFCWAFLVPLVLSIPAGKHHHYLLHGMVPWAMISSVGLVRVWVWVLSWPGWLRHPAWSLFTVAGPACCVLYLLKGTLPGPEVVTYGLMAALPGVALLLAWGMTRTNRRFAGGTVFGVVAGAFIFGHVYAGLYIDKNRLDARFCQEVARDLGGQASDGGIPLLMDLGFQTHRAFLCQFYLPQETQALHNLSFLRTRELAGMTAYVFSVAGKQEELAKYGQVEIVQQNATGAGGKPTQRDRLTVFRVTFPENFERVATEEIRISPMQGMNRAAGPEVGVWR